MLRAFLISPVLILLTVSPVVLAHDHDKDKNRKENSGSRFEAKIEIRQNQTQDATPSATCDPNANWKNHGAYVSCVARFEPGPHRLGGKGNSVAAKSSVGKKAPGPTATPSATPEPTPTATPSATPTATPSATASPSANVEVEIEAQDPLNQVISFLEQVLNFLKNLVL